MCLFFVLFCFVLYWLNETLKVFRGLLKQGGNSEKYYQERCNLFHVTLSYFYREIRVSEYATTTPSVCVCVCVCVCCLCYLFVCLFVCLPIFFVFCFLFFFLSAHFLVLVHLLVLCFPFLISSNPLPITPFSDPSEH